MQSFVRLGISAVFGLIVAVAVLLVVLNEIKFSQGAFFGILLAISLAISYLVSFATNTTINAISCPSVNVAKSATSALIPAGITTGIVLLFIMLESWTGIFGFIFKTVNFRFSFQSAYSNASIFGLLFAVFWAGLYGQLIGGSAAELCAA
jgi:hypothetical protein